MFNLSVNLGPSLHFFNKISKYIKSFFINFKTKIQLCLQTTKWPNYKIMQDSLSVPLRTHLGHHTQTLRWKNHKETDLQKERDVPSYS